MQTRKLLNHQWSHYEYIEPWYEGLEWYYYMIMAVFSFVLLFIVVTCIQIGLERLFGCGENGRNWSKEKELDDSTIEKGGACEKNDGMIY